MPMEIFGTKEPSMISKCRNSAPASSTIRAASARCPKSDASREGAICSSGIVLTLQRLLFGRQRVERQFFDQLVIVVDQQRDRFAEVVELHRDHIALVVR